MKKEVIMATARKSLANMKLAAQKNSPAILMAVGIIGAVTSAVMACRATLKADEIMSEHNENMEKIRNCPVDSEKYTEKDAASDKVIQYVHTGVKLAKLYAPAVALGALSIGSMVGSNVILKRRSAAMASAYVAMDKAFKEYRERAVDKFGEEVDKELRHGLKAVKVKEKEVDVDGNEKTVKRDISVKDSEPSGYAKFFDEVSPYWEKNPEYNLMFLRAQQNYANDKLRTQGYLFLNDVYDALGIEKTRAGQIVGWVYDEKNPVGDNYVDFGIYDVHSQAKREFVNGYERSILLDFNVDGPILEIMN